MTWRFPWFKRPRPVSLRPDPDFRERRLKQLSPDRRARYLATIAEIEAELAGVKG